MHVKAFAYGDVCLGVYNHLFNICAYGAVTAEPDALYRRAVVVKCADLGAVFDDKRSDVCLAREDNS